MPTMNGFLFGGSRFNLQLFAAPDTGGTGGSGAGGTGGDNPNAGGVGGGENKVSFSPEQQAELDRIVSERVNRANTTAGKKALEDQGKSLGYESYEAMEAAAKAYQAAKDKEKSDLQREQEAKVAAEAKAAQAEERAKGLYIRHLSLTDRLSPMLLAQTWLM